MIPRLLAIIAAIVASACGLPTSESAAAQQGSGRIYQLEYVVTPDPEAGGAWVEMMLSQSSHLLREVNMRAPAGKISAAGGDGEISLEDARLIWKPPPDGGSLRWFALIDHQRNDGAFDAHITADWAIFRVEDIIPQAATRALRGARSETTLSFNLPPGWSSLTEYFGREHSYRIRNTRQRFDRPAGWIILGEIGVRYDRIAGLRVNVAAPTDQGMRRIDILALLNWTLPEVLRLVPDFPKRLTIIGAGDPMWRGGLSGPRSLFIHADRPLISENATSTLLHEIMHIALGGGAGDGMDWLVEGLAEYYSLAVLHRSGTISDRRYAAAMRKQAEWGSSVSQLCESVSSGAITARAVTILDDLDSEIRTMSEGKKSLDDVLVALAASENIITLDDFAAIVRGITGADADALSASNLPGCEIR
ncbi:MAG: hypothetical protein IIA09_04850 [Proteobacteria bacterium]|nr:hypothetical protein [Pseudomonadota bacterium]